MPERSFPLRTASHLLRSETGSSPSASAASAAAAVGEALGPAYRVVEEFLEEGRKYAAGQSAWNNQATGGSHGAPPPDDLIRAMGWIFDQLGRWGGSAPATPHPHPEPQASSWPQPRWPATPPFHPQQDPRYSAAPIPDRRPTVERDWTDWDLEPANPIDDPMRPMSTHHVQANATDWDATSDAAEQARSHVGIPTYKAR